MQVALDCVAPRPGVLAILLFGLATWAAPLAAADYALIANETSAVFLNTRTKAIEARIALPGVAPGTQLEVAIAGDLGKGFIANSAGDLYEIDLRGQRLIRTIPAGTDPPDWVNFMTYNPATRRLFVSRIMGRVDVLDAATLATVASWPVPGRPGVIAVDPPGRRLYVLLHGQVPSLVAIDIATGTTLGVLGNLGVSAGGVVLSPDGRFAYVSYSNALFGTVGVVDTLTLTIVKSSRHVPCYVSLQALAIDESGTRLYLTCIGDDLATHLNVLDLAGLVQLGSERYGGSGISLTPDGEQLIMIEAELPHSGYARFVDVATLATSARVHFGDANGNWGVFTYSLPDAVQVVPIGRGSVILAAAALALLAGSGLRRRKTRQR